ncbi:MAG: BMP family ABC transporter substrate-binding protein [Anaerolineae bacterium]|nr:BMP family ABC transporter substrate-binding protein [Anaerolineae bacterium]
MRKLLSITLSLLVVFTLVVACGPKPTEAPATEEPAPTEKPVVPVTEEFQVGLVTDVGKVNDGTFNEYAYTGMMQAADEFGLENAYIETQQPTDYEKNVEQFVDEGFDMIVTVGFMMGETTQKEAEANPDVNFAIVDYAYDPAIPNVMGLVFREDQAGFMAGALAGLMTKSKTVGIVAGMEIPAVKKFRNGYENGVHYVCPECTVIGVYIDSFTDPARGKAAAESQMAEGADVIFGAGGPTGSGGILGAAQQGVWVIGVDQDEYFTTFKGGEEAGADRLLSSAMKRVDVAVYTAIKAAVEGTFKGSTLVLDASVNGVGLAPFNDTEGDVPDEVKAKLDEIFGMLAAGTLDTGVDPVGGDMLGAPAAVAPAGAGGTFIFGRGGDSVQLDPAIVTDGESFRVTGQCLEPLYQYEHGSTTPVPALATGCTPNADSTEWTCELREGVKFHDGTDFNADAVIFNFERWRFTDNAYHFASQVFEYYEYMWFGFDDASVITDIEKIDDYTVKFILADPLAPFLANLAMDMFAISSPAAIEKYGEDYGLPSAGCVGTGPFKFVEWVESDHIKVVANDDYWGGRPTIDEIIWRVIPDDSARFLALQSGDIHGLEQAVVEDLAAAEANPDLYVLTRPALNTAYLAFPYQTVEFQDVRVREAVAHAINREGLVENFYGAYGEVATNFLPPLVWGHDDAIEEWTYDPELAQQLLADAGYPDGLSEVTIAFDVMDAEGNLAYSAGEKLPLTLYYMPVTRFYYPSPQEIGQAMAADLTRAGFNIALELAGDWPTYLGLRREGRLPGLYMLGWGGDNGDPDNFHNYFFGGLSAADEAKEPDPREGWYANQEVAGLLYEAAVNPNQSEREAIYKQVEQLLHDDVARLWVAHNNTPLIFSSKISGYVPQPVGADYYEGVVIAQ